MQFPCIKRHFGNRSTVSRDKRFLLRPWRSSSTSSSARRLQLSSPARGTSGAERLRTHQEAHDGILLRIPVWLRWKAVGSRVFWGGGAGAWSSGDRPNGVISNVWLYSRRRSQFPLQRLERQTIREVCSRPIDAPRGGGPRLSSHVDTTWPSASCWAAALRNVAHTVEAGLGSAGCENTFWSSSRDDSARVRPSVVQSTL